MRLLLALVGVVLFGIAAVAANTVTCTVTTDADGAAVSFDDEGLKLKKPQQGSFTVLRTKDGVENLPEIDYDGDRWRFRLSDDGKSLVATYIPPGAVIVVR